MIYLKDLPNPLPRNWEVDIYLMLVGASDYTDAHVSCFLEDNGRLGDRYKLLSKQKVTFEVGDIDVPGIQIEELKKKKQKILSDAQADAERIERRIQSLLAIEYQPDGGDL